MAARHILFFDGASRGNPGHASSSFVIFNELLGKVVAQAGRYLGQETNNVAEYNGLLDGLKEASRQNLHDVAVRGDSKLVISQVQGLWKVNKPHLGPLCEQARVLSANVGVSSWAWIPRAENHLADALCNQALDKHGTAPAFKRKAPRSPSPARKTLPKPFVALSPKRANVFSLPTQPLAILPRTSPATHARSKRQRTKTVGNPTSI